MIKKEEKETKKEELKKDMMATEVSLLMVDTVMKIAKQERYEKQVWQILAVLCAVGILVMFKL